MKTKKWIPLILLLTLLLSPGCAQKNQAPERTLKTEPATVSNKSAPTPQKGPLEGITLCIDPGHQRKGDNATEPIAPGAKETKAKTSSGTTGVRTGIPEYVLNLEVSKLLQAELEKLGARVVMTRTTHDVDLSNVQRAEIANKANAALCIRVHADGSADRSVHGVSVLIPGNKYIEDTALLSESKKAGALVLEAVVKATGASRKGLIPRNDLTGFNWSTVPVILIETGFMSNPEEDGALNTKEYQQKIAEGIAQGVKEYFGKA